MVDANLLLWAHHPRFPQHTAARRWWAEVMSRDDPVGIPWPTIVAFVRISTHPRAFDPPARLVDTWAVVEEWLDRPNVWIPVPTDRHRAVYASLLIEGQAGGNHATDAHLAALAVEWGLELWSADRDFSRYPGLRWRNPLAA